MIHPDLRFAPFCHESPTFVLIPHTEATAEICPAKVTIFSLIHPFKIIFETNFSFGPLEQFTVIQDLEHGKIEVSGFSSQGFVSYEIDATGLHFVRGAVKKSFSFILPKAPVKKPERLSLGCHKAQDSFLIFRRKDIQEYLPIWFFLAQSIPEQKPLAPVGDCLLSELAKTIEKKDKNGLSNTLCDFFLASFRSLFFPRLVDDSHLGYSLPPILPDHTLSPLAILSESLPLVRSLFFRESDHHFEILPLLPKECHAGRLTNITTKNQDSLSIEWTKHSLRRAEIIPARSSSFSFKFPTGIKRLRVHTKEANLGFFSADDLLPLEKSKLYLLDRFEG